MYEKIEAKINEFLNRYPVIKRYIKRIYQIIIYSISKKEKSEGLIKKISPDDKYEYFFGYYDKSPWNASERYIICMKANDTSKKAENTEKADIVLIDIKDKKIETIAHTNSWNVQQGCMLQWLGPDFDRNIIYNDFRNGKFCSIILDIKTRNEKVLSKPVYSVSRDGKIALTLDFLKLHSLRYGYGYANNMVEDDIETCVWKINIEENEIVSLLKYSDLYNFEHRKDMEGAIHKVNHIMINPSGTRFMVLHRWFKGKRKYTRLITCDMNGKNLYNLSDDDMVSHCFWKNDEEILAFENKKGMGPGYYLMKDKSEKYVHLWPDLYTDGHPSYSPDRSMVITDTYPDRKRMSSLILLEENKKKILARVFSPFRYDNETRCDLHPRWDRKGEKICFDAVFEGRRGLYYIEVKND